MAQEKSPKIKVDFEDQSIEVDLENLDFSYSYGESRSTRGRQQGFLEIPAPSSDSESISAALSVVTKFEALSIKEALELHGIITSDPYVSVADGVIKSINREELEKWYNSDDFKAIQEKYEGEQPHQIDIIEFSATQTDSRTISVHYKIQDVAPSGLKLFGSSSAILGLDVSGNWKILVYAEHATPV
jgi:hypothetical protein